MNPTVKGVFNNIIGIVLSGGAVPLTKDRGEKNRQREPFYYTIY